MAWTAWRSALCCEYSSGPTAGALGIVVDGLIGWFRLVCEGLKKNGKYLQSTGEEVVLQCDGKCFLFQHWFPLLLLAASDAGPRLSTWLPSMVGAKTLHLWPWLKTPARPGGGLFNTMVFRCLKSSLRLMMFILCLQFSMTTRLQEESAGRCRCITTCSPQAALQTQGRVLDGELMRAFLDEGASREGCDLDPSPLEN